jgi:hypothetical protein
LANLAKYANFAKFANRATLSEMRPVSPRLRVSLSLRHRITGRGLMALDGLFLAGVGAAGIVAERVSAASGRTFGYAPLAEMRRGPTARLGWLEAHALALVCWVALLWAARGRGGRAAHLWAGGLHFLLAGANVLAWDGAARPAVKAIAGGTIGVHAFFALAQGFQGSTPGRGTPSGTCQASA